MISNDGECRIRGTRATARCPSRSLNQTPTLSVANHVGRRWQLRSAHSAMRRPGGEQYPLTATTSPNSTPACRWRRSGHRTSRAHPVSENGMPATRGPSRPPTRRQPATLGPRQPLSCGQPGKTTSSVIQNECGYLPRPSLTARGWAAAAVASPQNRTPTKCCADLRDEAAEVIRPAMDRVEAAEPSRRLAGLEHMLRAKTASKRRSRTT